LKKFPLYKSIAFPYIQIITLSIPTDSENDRGKAVYLIVSR